MRNVAVLAVFVGLTLLSSLLGAQEPGPVAAWTFNEAQRSLVRDVARDLHHLACSQAVQLADSPGGRAAVFDGTSTWFRATGRPELAMSDRLTMDVWLMVEDPMLPGSHCLVDKGGERYRLQMSAGVPALGLKGGTERLDLAGGKLQPGRWHRLTAVFDRPVATLYLDGQQVAQRTWDHSVDAGGDLNIGSKGGVTDLFAGQIDEARIYNYPRVPKPEDAPSKERIQAAGIRSEEAKMEVSAAKDGIRVDTGAAVFEFGDVGTLRRATIKGHAVVADNQRPLLSASIFESADYDGFSDYALGKVIEGTWRPSRHKYDSDQQAFTAAYEGRLEFSAGDALECAVQVRAERGSPFVTITTTLKPVGTFDNRFLREASVRLPTALNRRKRVVQAGDRGVQWDTRHFYQFFTSPTMKLLPEPEHNVWRQFATDQDSPRDFHIWRSESAATASLSMQRGLQAPGWTAVYDERAGLLLGYRGLSLRAPKSLRLNAEGSGEARACLWHEGLSPLALNSPQASAVVGQPHVTDWMLFTGDFTFTQPDVALAQRWGLQSLASDPPERNEVPLAELKQFTEPAADAQAPLVTGGVPMPRGALRDAAQVRLRDAGRDLPLQARPTGFWPDGSIKWLLLTFPGDGGEVTGAAGDGDFLTFSVSRRDGTAKQYRLDYGPNVRGGSPQVKVAASVQGDVVEIDTGPMQMQVAKGSGWLKSVRLGGRQMLAAQGMRSFVDFIRADNSYRTRTTLAQGSLDPGEFVPEKIELEEAGPLRAVIRLEGYTNAQEPSRLMLRVEAYAGRTVVRVMHSVEFLHKDVRKAYVRRMGLELPLADREGLKVTAGGQTGPVALAAGARAGLTQHSHLGYTAWHQGAGERFRQVGETNHRSAGWLDASGSGSGVAVMLRDMWQQFPNELVADVANGRVLALLWPESGPVMDVRRYSNYPHRSQGESVSASSDWGEKEYYGAEQFVGVSKSHELLLYFHTPETQPATVASVNADFQRPALVYCGPERYVATGVTLPQAVPGQGQLARMEANLDHYARFWMHHQELWGWYGFWDYGDVSHNYRGGYGWIVPPQQLAELVRSGAHTGEQASVSQIRISDYAPNHMWTFDNGRWGWTNTEGLPGLYMQNQYLRTGDRKLFFFAEAMARHVRDVDMRHDGRWFGQGTRHGVQHWSDGNHEERQTTHSEFRYIHHLSGDMRSYDFAKQLYERHYALTNCSVHAAHSGRWQGLLAWWELSGSPETARILERYAPCFAVDQGICISPSVSFPEVECLDRSKDINSPNMFFWTFGAGHGLLEYYYLTGHPGLKASLIKVADVALKSSDPGNLRKAVAFAARHADNPQPYREYLTAHAATATHMLQVVPHNPALYGGPNSFLNGGVSGSLFYLNDVSYMLGALPTGPQITPETLSALQRADQSGAAPYTMPRLSWQSDYDIPELQQYLTIKHPQP